MENFFSIILVVITTTNNHNLWEVNVEAFYLRDSVMYLEKIYFIFLVTLTTMISTIATMTYFEVNICRIVVGSLY